MTGDVVHRQLAVNGVELHIAEAGAGPLVLLLHGWPELWFSWRHQLPALAAAGYHVVAMDQRGYGRSTCPEKIEDYDIVHLGDDILALIDALGEDTAAVVGHDWGSMVAWYLAQAAPERLHGLAAMSIPFWPRGPKPPTQVWKEIFGDRFFYMLHFQTPGLADRQLARDPGASLRLVMRKVSQDVFDGTAEVPPVFKWLPEEDFAVYEAEFRRTGFTGGLNWYRNVDRNWELTAGLAERTIDIPTMFLAGERDPVLLFLPTDPMKERATDLREFVLVPGAGHWIQQERPAETNEALLRFLGTLFS